MTRRPVILLLAFLAAAPGRLPAADDTDAPGYFRTRQVDGRWWLIDPQGQPFISKGVTTVLHDQDYIQGTKISPYADTVKAKYAGLPAWREAVARRLLGWNFNTLGAWSDPAIAHIAVDGRQLAYTRVIGFAAHYTHHRSTSAQRPATPHTPDVFDPEFETLCQAHAQTVCAPAKNDPQLLGWFTDNELRWGPDWRGADELLVLFLNLPKDAPGHAAAFALLRSRYSDIAAFNATWRTAFTAWSEAADAARIETPPDATRRVLAAQNIQMERTAATDAARAFIADCDAFAALYAGRYFQVTGAAIRAADPHHLILGCRFAIVPPAAVIAAAVPHLDVISMNCYDPRGPTHFLDAYAPYPRPVLIGEFSYRGRDSGLPNTKGASPIVDTQEERAQGFADYVTAGLQRPNLVGYHWFEHADEPKEGRFDGENSNYGLVNIHDEPYAPLVARMSAVNARAEDLHRPLSSRLAERP